MTARLLRLNRRTFASLRHRNYRLFFSGQIVSVSGMWMQNVAMAWLILELTGSPVAVGILALCQFLPFTAFGLFSGVFVDRLDPRRTVIGTQAAQMVLASVLAALALLGEISAWQVYVLAALRGTVAVLDAPARQALTYQMVGPAELPNAVALNSSLLNGARVVGPALGGVIVAVAGAGFCFAVNAVTFLAVLAGLLLMRAQDLLPLNRRDRPQILRGTRDAFRYVRSSRPVALMLALVFLVSTFAFNFNVLLPVLARETLGAGPEVFGTLSACFGAGALFGALTSAAIGRASVPTLLLGTCSYGAAQLALAPVQSIAVCGLLLFATGFAFTTWTSNANSTLQLSAPDHLRGRVLGLYFYAFLGGAPLGGLLAGWLAATGGTELAFAFSGAVTLVASAIVFLLRLRPQNRPALVLDRKADQIGAKPEAFRPAAVDGEPNLARR